MSRTRIIRIALITALVVAAAAAGYTVSQLTAYSAQNYAARYRGSSPVGNPSPSAGSGSMGNMGNMGNAASPDPAGAGASAGFSSAALANRIAKQAGTRLAGRAPQTVSIARAKALSEQVPAGASIDRSTRTITFSGSSAAFTVVAVPSFGPDMTFGIAGMTNPAIVIAKGARVTVQFVNADPDEAHGWIVTTHEPPFTFGQTVVPAITGAYAGVLGDPTAGGDGAETITFQAGPAGTYQYVCPMPGHAQMGMHGSLIVR
jgi:rusticyanin